MADIYTTLHPENNSSDNLYPNIKRKNIPNELLDNIDYVNNINIFDTIPTRNFMNLSTRNVYSGKLEKNYTSGLYSYVYVDIPITLGDYTLVIKTMNASTNGFLAVRAETTHVDYIEETNKTGVYKFNVYDDGTYFENKIRVMFQISLGQEENPNYYSTTFEIYKGDLLSEQILSDENLGYDKILTKMPKLTPMIYRKNSLSSGVFGQHTNLNIQNNYTISFDCDINSFSGVVALQKGNSVYAESIIEITPTNLIVKKLTTTTETIVNVPHGLTIQNHLHLSIDVHNDKTADIVLITGFWYKKLENVEWLGNGEFLQIYTSTTTLNNIVMSMNCNYLKKDLWGFGDSYFDLWAIKASSLNYTNWMRDGYSGRGSAAALISLKECLKYYTPKKILWCLGMNDSDTETSVNSTWFNTYNEVVSICKNNNIELILSTIPNTPIRINYFKNEIIKNSGYRYIDIAQCVGAEEIGSTWYSALLNIDNIHPTDAGMYVIAGKFMTDLPECFDD